MVATGVTTLISISFLVRKIRDGLSVKVELVFSKRGLRALLLAYAILATPIPADPSENLKSLELIRQVDSTPALLAVADLE